MALFTTELGVVIAQDETDGCEEVGFARAVATDDYVVLGRERLNDCLVLVTVQTSAFTTDVPKRKDIRLEALDDDLFDVHLVGEIRMRMVEG